MPAVVELYNGRVAIADDFTEWEKRRQWQQKWVRAAMVAAVIERQRQKAQKERGEEK